MTDSDVQDIRDMVAKQKAEAANIQTLMTKMKKLVDNANMSKEDLDMLEHLKDFTARQERLKRLGLDNVGESSKS